MKNLYLKFAIVFIVIIIFFTPVFNMFTIMDTESNKIVYINKTSNIDEFYITFIHSVNRMPVNEYYRIVNNQFVVYKTTFYSYGAGMPDFEDLGQRPVLKDGMVNIDNLNINMKSFSIFIGTIANHSLNFNNKKYYLSQFVKPGKSAFFKIRKVSLYRLLRRYFYEWRNKPWRRG